MSCGHDGCTCGPDHDNEHAHGHGHELAARDETGGNDCCGAHHDADGNDHDNPSLRS